MQEIYIVIYSSLLLSIMICENIIQRMEAIKQKYETGTKKKENMKMSKEPALSIIGRYLLWEMAQWVLEELALHLPE